MADDTAIYPIPKQGKFRRALAAVGAWLQALGETGLRDNEARQISLRASHRGP